MSVSPGKYNFTIQRRADYSLDLQFKDSTDSAVDLTGSTVAAQAWDKERVRKYADFAIEYTSRSEGKIKISLTDAQTATFPETLYYDVLITNTMGVKDYYLEGVITVSQGYTE